MAWEVSTTQALPKVAFLKMDGEHARVEESGQRGANTVCVCGSMSGAQLSCSFSPVLLPLPLGGAF